MAHEEVERCRKCGKADGRTMLADQGGKWVHARCYQRAQDRADASRANYPRPLHA